MKAKALKPASSYNLNVPLFIKNILPQLKRVRIGVFSKTNDDRYSFAGTELVDLTYYFANTRYTLSDTITLLHLMLKRGLKDQAMARQYSLRDIYEYCFSHITSAENDFVEYAGRNVQSVGMVEKAVAEIFARDMEWFLKYTAVCCAGREWQDDATRSRIERISTMDALLTTPLPTDNPDNPSRLLISSNQKTLTDLAFTIKRHRNTLSHPDADDKQFFSVPDDEDERRQYHADTYSTLIVFMLMLVEHRFDDIMAAVCTGNDIDTDIDLPFNDEDQKKAHAYVRYCYSQPLRQKHQSIMDAECSLRIPLMPKTLQGDNTRIVICDVSGSGKTVYLRQRITDAEDSRLRFFVSADELDDNSVKGTPMRFVSKAISYDPIYIQVSQRQRLVINDFVESRMTLCETNANDAGTGGNKVEIYIDDVTPESIGYVEKIAGHYKNCRIVITTTDTSVAKRLAEAECGFSVTEMQRFSNPQLLGLMSLISLDRRKVDHGEILLKYYNKAFGDYELKGLPQFATIASRIMEEHEMYVGDYFNETRFCRQLTKYFQEENHIVASKLNSVKLFQQVTYHQHVAWKLCTDPTISTIEDILKHISISVFQQKDSSQLRRLFEQLEIIAEESESSVISQKAEKCSTLITVKILQDGITKGQKDANGITYPNTNLRFLIQSTRTLREDKLPVRDMKRPDVVYRPSPRYIVDRMILNILNVMQQKPITTLRSEYWFPAVKQVFDLAAQAGGAPLAKLFAPCWMELWLFNSDESDKVYGNTKPNQFVKRKLTKIVMETPHQIDLFMHLADQLTWLRAIPENTTNKVIEARLNDLILPHDKKENIKDDRSEDLAPYIVPMNDEELEQVVFRLKKDYPEDYYMAKLANDCILAMKKLRIVDRFDPAFFLHSDRAFHSVLKRCHEDPQVVQLMTSLLPRLVGTRSTRNIVHEIVGALVCQCCVNKEMFEFLAKADENIMEECRNLLNRMPLTAIPEPVRNAFFEDKDINKFIIDRVYSPDTVPEKVTPVTSPQYFRPVTKEFYILKGKDIMPIRNSAHYILASGSTGSRLRLVMESINTKLQGKYCVEKKTKRKFKVEQTMDSPDRIAEITIVIPSQLKDMPVGDSGSLCFCDSRGRHNRLQYTSLIKLTERRWILRVTNESLISKFLGNAEHDDSEYNNDNILKIITDNDILRDDYTYIEHGMHNNGGRNRSYVKVTGISIVNDSEDRTLIVLSPADKSCEEIPATGELQFFNRIPSEPDRKGEKKEKDRKNLPMLLSLNNPQRSIKTEVDNPMMFRSFVKEHRMLAFDESPNISVGQWIQWNDEGNTTEQIVSCFHIFSAWEVTVRSIRVNGKNAKPETVMPTQFFDIEEYEKCNGICSIYNKGSEWRCMLMFMSPEARSVSIPAILMDKGCITLAGKTAVLLDRKKAFKPYNKESQALRTLVCTIKEDGTFPEKYLQENQGHVVSGKFSMLTFNPYRVLHDAAPEPIPEGHVEVSSLLVEIKTVTLSNGTTVQRLMFPETKVISRLRALQYGINGVKRKFPLVQKSVASDGFIQLEIADECRQIWNNNPCMRIYLYDKEGQPAKMRFDSFTSVLHKDMARYTYHADLNCYIKNDKQEEKQ